MRGINHIRPYQDKPMTNNTLYNLLILFVFCVSCCRPAADFTHRERKLINESDSLMRVLTIEDRRDLKVLRATSRDLTPEMLLSDEFKRLSHLMLATVTHPSQDGVGIAAPQVGLNRRVVAVQRFDKEGAPFEIYPNVRLIWASDSIATGPEGCLSVPDRREYVERSRKIIIEYTDTEALEAHAGNSAEHDTGYAPEQFSRSHFQTDSLPVAKDTITGFTAVIFQHEIDHLDGILYIDRLKNTAD